LRTYAQAWPPCGRSAPGGILPELKVRARRVAQLGEAARIRINVLADSNRQRLQLLAAARGELGTGTYAPRG
jgi:hypothetical protein